MYRQAHRSLSGFCYWWNMKRSFVTAASIGVALAMVAMVVTVPVAAASSRPAVSTLPVVSQASASGSEPSVHTHTVLVTPEHMNGWAFFQEGSTLTATGALVPGPGIPPLGSGSAEMTLAATTDAMDLGLPGNAPTLPGGHYHLDGVPLAEMTALQYYTYESLSSTSTVQAIALQFNVAYNLPCSSSCSWQGRLVFEPYLAYGGSAITKGVWQVWDPMSGAGWWATHAPGSNSCTQGDPCTWAQVLADFPNIGMNPNPSLGAVILKAGSGWPAGFDGNVDALTIGVGSSATTYAFEEYPAQIADLTSMLPGSYSSPSSLCALNGIVRAGNELLVVGGCTNYGDVWNPLIGVYSLRTNQFSDLTPQFVGALSASNWYLTTAAWNGHSFLIVGVSYTPSGSLVPAMALYNQHHHDDQHHAFTDLSSQIPSADSTWLLSGVTWSGHEYMIVGYAPAATSTGVQPVMASYTEGDGHGPHGFTDLSANIPSAFAADYFLGVTWVAGHYLITGWQGSDLYPASAGVLLVYSPHPSNTWEDLSSLIPSNVFWLGTAAWHGDEILVVGVTYPDTPAVGVVNLQQGTYVDLTPAGTSPFPSTYYLFNAAACGGDQTFYFVGQSQQYGPGSAGASAIMGSITFSHSEGGDN